LYYLQRDSSAGEDTLWRANLDGSGIELLYTAPGTLSAFAVDEDNEPPYLAPDRAVTFSDTPVQSLLRAHDPNFGDVLAYSLAVAPAHGEATLEAYIVTYTPTLAFDGVDTFVCQVSDGRGGVATNTVEIDVTGRLVESSILSPTHGTVIHIGESLWITTALRAHQGAARLDIQNGGVGFYYPILLTAVLTPVLTETQHAFLWTPTSPGKYNLYSVLYDSQGTRERQANFVTVYVIHDQPSVTIAPTVLTTTHQPQWNGVGWFWGTVGDDAGGHTLEVTADGNRLYGTQSSGAWRAQFFRDTPPDGITYTVVATVTDYFGAQAVVTEIVTVDVAYPAPVEITLGVQGQGSLQAGETVRSADPTLTIDWTASSDGSGVAGY
jgi:hypothetical protein